MSGIEVTQADRDAAADYGLLIIYSPLAAEGVRAGRHDDYNLVQAFARHRLAAVGSVEVEVPDVCDGKEQDAFEEWARSERFVMDTHPLHWLFLDKETNAARRGWSAAIRYCRSTALRQPAPRPGGGNLWLWRNFVDGRPEYWAFDNPYPCDESGDPMTLGEPCGYAIVKQSINGRPDVSDDEALQAIYRAEGNHQPAAENSQKIAKTAPEEITIEGEGMREEIVGLRAAVEHALTVHDRGYSLTTDEPGWEAARRSLALTAGSEGWRSIGTVPSEPCGVIFFYPGSLHVGFPLGSDYRVQIGYWKPGGHGSGWFQQGTNHDIFESFDVETGNVPSHWMPLPSPPDKGEG